MGTQNRIDENFNGVTVRWRKLDQVEQPQAETTPVARRFQPFTSAGEKSHRRHEKKDNFEDVIAGTVKAFVGLIYRERVST